MLTEKKQRVAKESGAAVEPEQEQTRAAGPEVEAEQVRETEQEAEAEQVRETGQEAEAEQVRETGQEAEAERGREQSKPRSSKSQNRRKPAVRQENPGSRKRPGRLEMQRHPGRQK